MKEMFMSFNRSTVYETDGMTYSSLLDDCICTNVNYPVYYFIFNVDNYYHFIYDAIPYLYFFLKLKDVIPNIKLLMQYADEKKVFNKFVYETLEILGITSDDIIVNYHENVYDTFFIQSSMTHGGASNSPPCKEVYEIYEKMIHTASQQSSFEFPKKIYISRRSHIHGDFSNIGTNYTQRRKLICEDKLVEELQNKGFTEVFGEKLNMIDKINMFNKAEIIVGAIGGGMCNLLFSPPSVKSIVILSPCFMDINERFRFSMEHTNIKYYYNFTLVVLGHEVLGHSSKTIQKIAKYMRVKILTGEHEGKYGEIEDFHENKYLINLGSTTSVSIKADKCLQEMFSKDMFEILDNGLNSPWNIDVTELVQML
jgi:hypothetical protein